MPSSNHFPTSSQYIVFWVEVIQNSQNISNNTSNVTVKVWVKRTNSGYETWGSGTVYTNINGVQRNVGISPNQKITSTPMALFHQDLTISHNNDGTKTLNCQAGITHDMFHSLNNANYNVKLTTIPRASSFTMSASTIEAGKTLTLNISRASSNFTHNTHIVFGNGTFGLQNGVATTATGTVSMEILKQITGSATGTGTVYVDTYNGSTKIGTTSRGITITAPSNVIPSYSSLGLTRIDNVVPNAWGVYVKSKSKAKIVINQPTGAYGSIITKYSISGDGYSSTTNELTTGVFNSAGNITFTGVITDSRGRTCSKSISCTVVDYSNPAISSYDLFRCNQTGTADEEGLYVKVTANFTYSNVNNKNVLKSELFYRKLNATSWYKVGTISSGVAKIFGSDISPDNSYEIKLVISDTFETIEKIITIPTASTTLDFRQGGKGIAIGKVSEVDGLEVDWVSFYNKFVTLKDSMSIAKNLTVNGEINTNLMKVKNDNATASNSNWFNLLRADGTRAVDISSHNNGSGIRFNLYNTLGESTSNIAINTNGNIECNSFFSNGSVTINEQGKQLLMGCGASDVFFKNSKSGLYLQFADDGNLKIGGNTIGDRRYPIREKGNWFSKVPVVGSDGVLEIGKYIDFHDSNTTSADYTYRLDNGGSVLYHSGSLQQASDRNLKENIVYLDKARSFSNEEVYPFKDFIKNFRTATFNYKGAKEENYGFVAQDMYKHPVGQLMVKEFTRGISSREDGTINGEETILAFDLSAYTTVVAKALQEEILEKDRKIMDLENRLKLIEEKLGL